MDVEPVRIEGYGEILALHRMLIELKFDDLDSEYGGSPFSAAIQHRLADALEACAVPISAHRLSAGVLHDR